MKLYRHVILFLTMMSSISSFSKELCFSKQNSKEFFFINGVWNFDHVKTQEDSLTNLKKNLDIKMIALLFNDSEGWLADVEETFGFMKFNNKETNFQTTLWSEKKYASKSKEFYSKLSKDKINIIIAHSEGNLFGERLCQINDDNKIIENIAIAPPLAKLSCNTHQTYVLFNTDLVINKIDVLKRNFKELDHTHEKFFLDVSHSLKSYLDDSRVSQYLKEKINLTIDTVYAKNFNFPLATIEIERDGSVKKFINNLEDTKDSVVLWSREKKAFFNIVSYSTELASSFNKTKMIKKILETEIPAQDEQEFADMIAYSLNSLNSYCKSSFPQSLKPLCSKIGVKDYFNQKELIDPQIVYNKIKDWKLSISCQLASQSVGKEFPVSLMFQKRLPAVSFNKEHIDLKYEVNSEKIIYLPIGTINIDQSKDGLVSVNFTRSNLENINSNEFKDKLTQCNSLKKLSSKNCSNFLQHLESKYFTKR